jgi:response regulator of citrate/malate metabolism
VIRTLVVDDDALVAEVHAAYVERVPGFAVVGVVHRATEALEHLAHTATDLVLLDFQLPDAHGLDVCRALRARGKPPVDVIAVTAARDVETVRRAVSQGVVQYLIKPFSFAAFKDKLDRYAAYRAELGRRDEADQAAVDAMLGTLRGTSGTPLPKGLQQATLTLVADVLRQARDELSAAEVAEAAGAAVSRAPGGRRARGAEHALRRLRAPRAPLPLGLLTDRGGPGTWRRP